MNQTQLGASERTIAALRRWRRSAALAVVLLVFSLLGLSLYGDTRQLQSALAGFELRWLLAALSLSLASYGLRALRFQLFLRGADVHIPHAEAVLIFLSGMCLSATPGKVGEVLKSLMLKRRHAITFEQSVPVIVVERISDLLALLLLTAWGVALLAHGWVASLGLLVLALLVFVGCAALPWLTRRGWLQPKAVEQSWRGRLATFASSLARASRPRWLLLGAPLALGSWGCQVLCLWTVVRGFELPAIELQAATFAYCVPLLAGVIALLPGGLGVTEVGMVHSLQLIAVGTTPALAASITLLVRLATFWFAMLVGTVALLLHRRYFPWVHAASEAVQPAFSDG